MSTKKRPRKKTASVGKLPIIEAYESEGAWGVHEVYSRTQRYTPKGVAIASACTIYDAMFSEKAARRVAQLEARKTPPNDWEATKEILLREGFTDATIDAPRGRFARSGVMNQSAFAPVLNP